jgi:hypothetical protein
MKGSSCIDLGESCGGVRGRAGSMGSGSGLGDSGGVAISCLD